MTKISMKTAVSFLLVTCLALVGLLPGASADDDDDAGPIPCNACGAMSMHWHVDGTNYVDFGVVGFFDDLGLAIYWGALGQVTCDLERGQGNAFMYASADLFESGPCSGGYSSATSPPLVACTMELGLDGDLIGADGSGSGVC